MFGFFLALICTEFSTLFSAASAQKHLRRDEIYPPLRAETSFVENKEKAKDSKIRGEATSKSLSDFAKSSRKRVLPRLETFKNATSNAVPTIRKKNGTGLALEELWNLRDE